MNTVAPKRQGRFRPCRPKKGQMEMPFNWIYVLIAGGVILLFFVGIVVKQKASAAEQLGTEVNQILSSITSAASSAETTKVVIQLAGFAEESLSFQCSDGVTKFGILGKGKPAEDLVTPLFAPALVQSGELLLWSLPFHFPYKITDFLYVTAPTVQYVLVGNDVHVQEFLKEAKSSEDARFAISVMRVDDIAAFSPSAGMKSVRIVDYTGQAITGEVPSSLQVFDDVQVSAVVFQSGAASFFQKKGAAWRSDGSSLLFTLGGELDAVHFAAIFAQNKEMFDCGMTKALQRAKHVSRVYAEKGKALLASPAALEGTCPVTYSGLPELLIVHPSATLTCAETYPLGCPDAVQSAGKLRAQNELLFKGGCVPLY
ncbi:hypothetical protein HY496_01440 [Candidatus Woesearchaeota archaeon]|nr:hypothetical protein [Candidatus Woesearchaeota archaeon]